MRRLRHSPGTTRLSETLREIAEIVAIAAIAATIGVAAGKGLSALTGDGETSQPASGVAATPTPVAAPAPAVRVHVIFAGLRPLADGAGEPSDRSRLRVGLRLRNRSDRRATLDVPGLQVGQSVVRADDGDDLARRLGEGLDAGASVKGELRFSTGAVMTRQLVRLRRATLLIAGRRIPLRFDVASEPAQDAAATTTPNTTKSAAP